jgi:hypothetical protein
MKSKLYVETSVISYLAARPSRDLIVAAHQQITHEWWDNRRFEFDLYISQLVLTEAKFGDSGVASTRLQLLQGIPLLDIHDEVAVLAQQLLSAQAIYHERRRKMPFILPLRQFMRWTIF